MDLAMAEAGIRRRWEALSPWLDERLRRLWAGAEAADRGHGGVAAVARATGLHPDTVARGARDLEALRDGAEAPPPPGRTRRDGAGRPRAEDADPTLVEDLEALVSPTARGDPTNPLRWTLKSVRRLAGELRARGHAVGPSKVGELLHDLDYSLQANRRALEGGTHPQRDAQFTHINRAVARHLREGNPAVSVDAKKKELVGPFHNKGREWNPKGEPEDVNVHDFPSHADGRAVPYGVYDLARNEGWVSVGVTHDTAAFAVASIRRWWREMGEAAYPGAASLLITCDAGGSNGVGRRLWKAELQTLANDLGFPITVCHLPPGTSKWNKIEHFLFAFIATNWRGTPLASYAVVLGLIGATTNAAGLAVRCGLDPADYPTGLKVPDREMRALNLREDRFRGDWNYTLSPQPAPEQLPA